MASMSVADSSSHPVAHWEIVLGDEDYGKLLSVRTESDINSTVVRMMKKGQVFATVAGAPTIPRPGSYYTRYQLVDGGWISQTEQGTADEDGAHQLENGSWSYACERVLAVKISADVYAERKAALDAVAQDLLKQKNNVLAAKLKHVEQLVADNTANTSTFEYMTENGKPYVDESGRSIGSGGVNSVAFLKDGTFQTTKNHSWSREEMNGSCRGGGYTLDVSGKYFCDGDGNVAGYVTKVNYNPQSSGATEDGDATTVPEVHDLITGTYVNQALMFSFVSNPAK